MMAFNRPSPNWFSIRSSFDTIVEQAANSRLSFDEANILKESHWKFGQDARLREDVRFRPTPWGRWILANAFLANDTFFIQLKRRPRSHLELNEALRELEQVVKRHCVFCPGDPRFVVENGTIRFSARELTNQPLIEKEITEIEKYTTHLPIHSLRAAAASLPAMEWGRNAQEHMIDTLGWVKVSLPGKKLNSRMFVAQIEGHSMDDGKSGLVDGGYAIFEFWPAGTKQFMNVLVRGAFSDPETGSYAVKKYVADQRDVEGRHQRITLVSLNLDKGRYPDIELDVENDEDITVVAKVVQALSPKDFARKPKPIRRPGRRDLSSNDAVENIFEDLALYAERFFELPTAKDEIGIDELKEGWSAQLVCLEAEAGGLQIEAGPFTGLWSFVKQLRIKSNNWETSILASNIRQRQIRIPIPASAGPWHWVAAGFEDDPDIDLTSLSVGALQSDRVHVFRLDAEDVGRIVANNVLSLGQSYRILLPDTVYDSLEHKPATTSVGDGWRIWELTLSTTLPLETQEILRKIGLDVGEIEPRLEWVLVPPILWRETAKGDTYPCFLSDMTPVISVNGLNIYFDGEASLFLYGPSETKALSLKSGSRPFVQLEDLAPGRYCLLFLHDRTRIPPLRLPFEVLTDVPYPPAASWRLTIGSDVLVSQSGSLLSLPLRDLSMLDLAEDCTALLEAPPGWPVRIFWKEISEDQLCAIQTDINSQVDFSKIISVSREKRNRRAIGDLIIDLAELGSAVIRHERRPKPETIRSNFAELIASRGATVQHLAGAYAELLPIWFEPICAVLGYDVESVSVDDLPSPPNHIGVFRLLHTERHGGKIERQPVRLLFLVEDLQQGLSETLLEWIDEISASERLRDILLSDGLRWTDHRRGSRLISPVWDIAKVMNDPEEFVSFLRVASEGI
ncbi:MAG: hypothetical protein AB1489_15540 [Acidobacteriota bacterium]